MIHGITKAQLEQFWHNVFDQPRRPPHSLTSSASSTTGSWNSRDNLSTTSSVLDPQVAASGFLDVDVEDLSLAVAVHDSPADNERAFSTLLRGIGTQFIHVRQIWGGIHPSIDLPASQLSHPGLPFPSSSLPPCHSHRSEERIFPWSSPPWPRTPPPPLVTLPRGGSGGGGSNITAGPPLASTGRAGPEEGDGPWARITTSTLIPAQGGLVGLPAAQALLTAPTTTRHHKSQAPRFLNPFYVLKPDSFSKAKNICCQCYQGRPDGFFRAIFIQAKKDPNISDDTVKKAGISFNGQGTEHRLRYVWNCLFPNTLGTDSDLPVAGADHICKHRTRRADNPSQLATDIGVGSFGTLASLPPGDQSSAEHLGHVQHPSRVPHASDALTTELDQDSELWSTDLFGMQPIFHGKHSDARDYQRGGIAQYLTTLHDRTHSEPWHPDYVWRIRVLTGALRSVRALLGLATDAMHMAPPVGRNTALFQDICAWSRLILPPFDRYYEDSNVHSLFIQNLNGYLQLLHKGTAGPEHEWRLSVLDLALERIGFVLDHASRDISSPSNSGSLYLFPHEPRSSSAVSPDSQLSPGISGSNSAISSQSRSTAATSVDGRDLHNVQRKQ